LILSSIFCGLLACIPGLVWAAEPGGILRDFAVRTWNKADGLPDDSVTTLLQTRDGYLWIGTGNGIARFDGVHFTQVPLTRDSGQTISISALCEDNSGRLWIGSQAQGLFSWQAGLVRHYGRAEGLLDETITGLAVDSEGRLWVGTHQGLNRWDGRTWAAFTTRDGLPDDSVSAVHAARSGTVWITTRGGMCRWMQDRLIKFHFPTAEQERDQEFLEVYEDVRGNLWAFCATYLINLAEGKRINYFPGEKSASMRVWSLCESRDGRLWIGASGRGVFRFDGANFQPVTLSEGRWPSDVRTLCEDHEGSLWLGIPGSGLTQLSPQSFVLLKGSQGLPAGAAVCALIDPGGRLCVGMEAGGVYASTGERFEPVPDETRTLDQVIPASLCATPDGALWAGTLGAGLYQLKAGRTALCTTANGLSDDSVLAVCVDPNQTVWAGTRSGALHRLTEGRVVTYAGIGGLAGQPITALLPARLGGLWVGTGGGRLLRSDSSGTNFEVAKLTARFEGKAILGLYESGDRQLWIGSAGGLGCLDPSGCTLWNTQDGLPDDAVLGVIGDREGNLWLTTGKGICRLPEASVAKPHEDGALQRTKLVFETEAGANQTPSFGWPRAVRSTEGQLWFATASGLIGIDTRSFHPETPPPQVHLEAVLADGKPLDLAPSARSGPWSKPAPLALPPRFRALELQFTALSFTVPEKVRFRHKLDKFDADWIETGTERRVRYSRLPSGQYEFHVTACNAEGVWNETGAVLAFVIPTPLWRAPWALGLYGFTVAGGVAGTVRLVSHRRLRRRLARLEQQQAMERERVRIAQDMHDEIGSKLTKISFLSEMAKSETRESGALADKIDSIAGTSRELLQALDEIVWAVNPRNDTLEQLCAYLSQYAREYFKNTAVECLVRLQHELPQLAMSAEVRHNLFLAFEEALNNVLKHAGASTVQVAIRLPNERLEISIRDNGRGFSETGALPAGAPANSAGDGLPNMRQRLAEVGGDFAIHSQAGQGTTVTLSISFSSAKLRE